MAEIVYCKYCANPIDLDNSYIHDTCKDWYTFILDSMIEEMKMIVRFFYKIYLL